MSSRSRTPTGGDLARKLGNVPALNQELMGTSFLAQNANKQLAHPQPEARRRPGDLPRASPPTADVVVENFRPGVMTRLGVGYETLRAVNPRLIYCAISGFGQTGPDADKPAYDQIIQGLSGVMDVNGDERLHPLRCGFPVCDTVGGLNAAFAIMGALYHRERTGEGQFIDIAMLDSVMPLMGWVAANLLIGGVPPVPMGNDNFTAAPSGVFVTQDGYINIAANQQEQWESVCDVLGVPELKTDPRFEKRDVRKANRQALTPLLEAKLAEHPTSHWVEVLNRKGVPVGRDPRPRGRARAAADRAPWHRSRPCRSRASATCACSTSPRSSRRRRRRSTRLRRACPRTPTRSSAASATRPRPSPRSARRESSETWA